MSTISGVSGSGNAWANASTQRSNHQAKMFAKVDTNGDGGVDQAELGTMLDKISQKTGTSLGDTAKVFASMDSDGNGSLSATELGEGMKSIMPSPPSTMAFAQAHQGGPHGGGGGPQGAGGSSSASTTFDPLDTNQDGKVSEAERLAGDTKTDPLQALFKAIDTDSDVSASTTADASKANASFDISKLAQMLYDKVASGLSQSANSSSLSAIA